MSEAQVLAGPRSICRLEGRSCSSALSAPRLVSQRPSLCVYDKVSSPLHISFLFRFLLRHLSLDLGPIRIVQDDLI